MEEIDINYCKFTNKEAFSVIFTNDLLTDKVHYILEMLEQQIPQDKLF